LKFKCVQSTVRTSKCRKVNNEMFRVQILGSHLRSREVYRVCMDIMHSLHERYVFIRTYVRMEKSEETSISNGTCRRYVSKGMYQLYVRTLYGIEMLRGEREKCLSVPL